MAQLRAKYGTAKRLLTLMPGAREALANAYVKLPLWLSRPAYSVARNTVFRDNNRRMPVFEAAFAEVRQAAKIGDYLEFGVGRGTSLITANKISRRMDDFAAMRFHAFDSFEGLPCTEGPFVKGEMAYDQQVFARFITAAGVPISRVTTSKGFFDRSLSPELAVSLDIERGRAHIVHIDCDLYRSTVPVLDFIAPLLGIGSVVIFDDWFAFDSEKEPWRHGEQRAFIAWSERDRFEPIAVSYRWNAAWKLVR